MRDFAGVLSNQPTGVIGIFVTNQGFTSKTTNFALQNQRPIYTVILNDKKSYLNDLDIKIKEITKYVNERKDLDLKKNEYHNDIKEINDIEIEIDSEKSYNFFNLFNINGVGKCNIKVGKIIF